MIEQTIEIPTRDGATTTFIVHPDRDGPHPVILFFMDAPAIREELRDMARRLATAGHYGGEVFPYLLLLNPTDVFRILNVFSTEDVRSAYGLTSTVPPLLAHPGELTGVMLAWIALPLALANWRFKP